MKSSLLASVRNCLVLIPVLSLVGCGPDDGVAEREEGIAAFEVNDFGRAEKKFTESLALDSDNPDTLIYLARIKIEQGELAAARDFIRRAQVRAMEDIDVRLLSAQLAWHAKDYAESIRLYSAISTDMKLGPELRSRGWTGVAIVEMTCDNKHLARAAFLHALRLDPRNPSARYHLGLLYRDNFGYYEAALDQFDCFVRLETVADPRVQRTQRTIIPELKDKIASIAAERPGVGKRDAAACSSALAKAEAAMKKKQVKAASQAYQEALKADPLSYPAALGLAKSLAAVDAKKSYENYRLACTLSPSAIATHLTTAALAAKMGRHAEAMEIYSRALAVSPASLTALDGLITELRKLGNKGQVVKAYQGYRDFVAPPRQVKK